MIMVMAADDKARLKVEENDVVIDDDDLDSDNNTNNNTNNGYSNTNNNNNFNNNININQIDNRFLTPGQPRR